MKLKFLLILCLIFLNINLNASTYNENVQENNIKADVFIEQLKTDNPEKEINIAYIKGSITKGILNLINFYCSEELIKKIAILDWLTSLNFSRSIIENPVYLYDLGNLKELTALIFKDVRRKNNSKWGEKITECPIFIKEAINNCPLLHVPQLVRRT